MSFEAKVCYSQAVIVAMSLAMFFGGFFGLLYLMAATHNICAFIVFYIWAVGGVEVSLQFSLWIVTGVIIRVGNFVEHRYAYLTR